MVYTQARLDEALSAFRECKKYFERRGLKTANLESHLGRKYDFRKPPPETVFTPRPALWAGRDDDSDGEFDPSYGRKKRKSAASEPRLVRLQQKRRLSASGDESARGENKRRKPKGTTWAQGRRLGRSMIETFKFTKTENLEVLKDLLASRGRGSAKMPYEEAVNVFNANNLDSGFASSSMSDPMGDLLTGKNPERLAGTVIDPSVGLATPRGSIGGIEALQSNAQGSSINTADVAEEPTRDLRNRTVPVNLTSSPKRLRSCLTCKEDRLECSLIKSSPDYACACDACKDAGSPCRINEEDEPRMGPVDRMLAESEKKKRSIEEHDDRGGKRRNVGKGNIGSIFSKEVILDVGKSMLTRKKKDKEEDKFNNIHRLHNHGKAILAGNNPRNSLLPLDTGPPNSSFNFSKPADRDTGYYSSPNNTASKFPDINMGNTLDTAISLSDTSSPPTSPITGSRFDADYTTTIVTNWAHPVSFQHQPKSTGLPCHFCDDFRYGLFGLGTLTVEVAWDHGAKSYIEISGGHTGAGREASRMCAICALERLRIRFCGHGCSGKRTGDDMASKHQLREMPAWRGGTRAWMTQLQMKRMDPGYSGRPALPPCHLCLKPATARCGRVQERNTALQPLKDAELGRQGCGLRLCEPCRDKVEGAGGRWVKGEILGKFERADAEFLFAGGLLERAWGDYLGSVGLL